VLRAGAAAPHARPRPEQAAPYAARIRELHARCQGNLVRVQEELAAEHVVLAYSTLTGFCRRHGIGVVPPQPVGRYVFAPGQEMQHDTSPHRVTLGGQLGTVQCASLVLCYSRLIFAQVYPVWNRFWCKVFLTAAVRAFAGAARTCMVDNSHVVLATGRGPDAVMAPEMVAFGRRFGFVFVAHAVGHAERSGRVERPFHFIEHNFYPGRDFADVPDLNAQLRAWCGTQNAAFKKHLQAVPAALYAQERPALVPLPAWVPAVEQIHVRRVDAEGFVHLYCNRYSAPLAVLGREIQVHEGADQIRLFHAGRLLATHPRLPDGAQRCATLPAHRDGRQWRYRQPAPPQRDEERVLRASSPVAAAWLDAARARGRLDARMLRRVHGLWVEFPRGPLERVLVTATAHGLFEVARIETMVLRELATDFFRLPAATDDRDPGEDDDDDPGR